MIGPGYDRFVIIGELDHEDSFVATCESPQKSSCVFGDRLLTVGAAGDVKEPIYANQCLGNDNSNPIFQVTFNRSSAKRQH